MKININRVKLKQYMESYRTRVVIRLVFMLAVGILVIKYFKSKGVFRESDGPMSIVYDENNVKHVYDSQTHPLIFIGGHPRSGTTLMRAMLDAHSSARCGEETRIIPSVIQFRERAEHPKEKVRLDQAGITDEILDRAMAAFVLETIAQHGHPPKVLCNKDPLLLNSATYIKKLFPKSKWIFMIRDGRAVVHSILKRGITITGFPVEDPAQALRSWNNMVERLADMCAALKDGCLPVQYEQLVLHPRSTMERILAYLDLPWEESVMHHDQYINQEGDRGVRVSIRERTSDQVVKPVNLKALTEWAGTYSDYVVSNMGSLAPMLQELGYDPSANPPNYGQPDPEVASNTRDLEVHQADWENKTAMLLKQMEKHFN
jgi:protein-tyrosine sulfotransferase